MTERRPHIQSGAGTTPEGGKTEGIARSLVIPVYRNEDSIGPLVDALKALTGRSPSYLWRTFENTGGGPCGSSAVSCGTGEVAP